VGLDTSIFIFQVEENSKYVGLTDRIFNWIKMPKASGVTSTITMLEVLVQPYRDADEERVDGFYALLSSYPHLEWIETSLEIADRAAQLRADFKLRTPDAIQAATALTSAATGFISNDPVFRRVPEFESLILDDVL
jgi:predicted nucleic acid-binding protein